MINGNIGISKIYIQDEEGEYKELGTATELEFESDKNDDAFTEAVCKGWSTKDTFTIRPIYKAWYKKKRGKRFIRYYKIKQGIDPKIIKLLIGGKDG